MHKEAARFLVDQTNGSNIVMIKKGTRPSRPPTIFHAIHNSTLPPHEKSVDRMAEEALVIIAAGGETTSRVLTMAIYYLLVNPAALKRLNGEIFRVMPNVNVMPSVKSLETLPWLVSSRMVWQVYVTHKTLQSAVIKETLRIAAIITSRFPLMAPYELQFREWTIPSKVHSCPCVYIRCLN